MSFHRKESDTQTPHIAKLQQQSLEVWGKEPRGSNFLAVQAYKRRLPEGKRGIEFDTFVLPNPDGHPHNATWSGERPGIMNRNDDTGEYVAINVFNFINQQTADLE
jgi:hypothetical protein